MIWIIIYVAGFCFTLGMSVAIYHESRSEIGPEVYFMSAVWPCAWMMLAGLLFAPLLRPSKKNPADYLSTEDAARMMRAYYLAFANPGSSAVEAMKLAWSSRPESARRLDEALLEQAASGLLSEDVTSAGISRASDILSHSVGRELLKASGGE